MAGGRPARPAALKLLNGRTADTDSGGRKVGSGPAFARSAPEPPNWLSPEAQAEWDRVVPELTRLRLIATISRATLIAYVQCWAQYVDTVERWERHAATDKQLNDAGVQLRQWAREFGLTPSSEAGLHPPELPDLDDPFA